MSKLTCSIRDNFLIKLNNCRNEIDSKFKQISDNLLIRQNQLLTELDGIEKKYSESRNAENLLKQAEYFRNEQNKGLQGSFITENIISNITQIIESLDVQIADLRQKLVTFTNIDIELDTDNINTLIDKLGYVKLTEDILYKEKNRSTLPQQISAFLDLIGTHDCNNIGVPSSASMSTKTYKYSPQPSSEKSFERFDFERSSKASELSAETYSLTIDNEEISNKIGDIYEVPKVQIANALPIKSTRKNVVASKDSPPPTSRRKEDFTENSPNKVDFVTYTSHVFNRYADSDIACISDDEDFTVPDKPHIHVDQVTIEPESEAPEFLDCITRTDNKKKYLKNKNQFKCPKGNFM